ncbi:MAG: hypothetical protein JEZ06_13480 [Anaerolineaceae bacterium]|nr:hypothetical protein [Anaerolineaceae bacterium]
METNKKVRLTLDQSVVYQIQIPEHIDERGLDWVGDLTVKTRFDDTGAPITILTGKFDQAALIGTLRRIYSLGMPLILVKWLKGS